MPANRKRLNGLSIMGFVFWTVGFVFFLTGNAGIGISQMALGMVLIVSGVATTRTQDDKK